MKTLKNSIILHVLHFLSLLSDEIETFNCEIVFTEMLASKSQAAIASHRIAPVGMISL
jgi:hypothetical protein